MTRTLSQCPQSQERKSGKDRKARPWPIKIDMVDGPKKETIGGMLKVY